MNIFISYRRSDSDTIAGRIDDHLARHFGRSQVFLDTETIPPGADFTTHIRSELSHCQTIVVVIGQNWDTKRLNTPDDFVRLEVEQALSMGIPIVPVLVDGATMPSPDDLPPSLRPLTTRNAIPIETGSSFKTQVNRLIHHVGTKQRRTRARRAVTWGAGLSLALLGLAVLGYTTINTGTFGTIAGSHSPKSGDEVKVHEVLTSPSGAELGVTASLDMETGSRFPAGYEVTVTRNPQWAEINVVSCSEPEHLDMDSEKVLSVVCEATESWRTGCSQRSQRFWLVVKGNGTIMITQNRTDVGLVELTP